MGCASTDRLAVGDEMRSTVENCSAYAHFFGTSLPSLAVQGGGVVERCMG